MPTYSANCVPGSAGSTNLNRVRLTELPSNTVVSDDDLFFMVDDPAGVPTTQSITALNLRNYFNAGGNVYFSAGVPLAAVGQDGDLAFVDAGDLAGATYEKVAGVWGYIGQYRTTVRTAHPATASLPTGFQWMLVEQTDISDNGIYEWDGANIYQRVAFSSAPASDSETVTFTTVVPNAAVGQDGDQAFITGGDLTGAIYEKNGGVWSFVGLYRETPWTVHPATASMPSGFQWRLIAQADATDNGLYEWDGTNIVQLTTDSLGTGTTTGAGNTSNFATGAPSNATGQDGDVVSVVTGDLAGAMYEKVAGTWVYVTQFRDVPRNTHPATGSLPTGFQWRLVQQVNPVDNGLYMWDGFNIIQLS